MLAPSMVKTHIFTVCAKIYQTSFLLIMGRVIIQGPASVHHLRRWEIDMCHHEDLLFALIFLVLLSLSRNRPKLKWVPQVLSEPSLQKTVLKGRFYKCPKDDVHMSFWNWCQDRCRIKITSSWPLCGVPSSRVKGINFRHAEDISSFSLSQAGCQLRSINAQIKKGSQSLKTFPATSSYCLPSQCGRVKILQPDRCLSTPAFSHRGLQANRK